MHISEVTNYSNININRLKKSNNITAVPKSNTADSFVYNTSQNVKTLSLYNELNNIKKKQGIIGKTWDGIKNFLKLKSGSKKVEEQIKLANEGKITKEEALNSINKYNEGQKTCVDVAADIVSGILAMGAFALAVPTGGASLAVGLGLATTVGAGVKIGIKAGDALSTGKEYKSKDLLYDTLTGAVNGVMAPVTNGIGASLTKTVGQKLGLKVVQEGAETAVKQGIKQGLKSKIISSILTQNVDVAGGTLLKRAVAIGSGFAIDGAISGASDNMVRAALNGEDVLKSGVQGAIGGAIAAPIIGGGFKAAGKAGRAINNKITMRKILPDGVSTKFRQGTAGDCALLSTIDGMMNNSQTQKLIKKSITKTFGGDYNVKIGDNIIKVAKSSLTDDVLSGKTGIKLFELAYKQLTGNLDGDFAEIAAKQFGLNPIHITSDSITDEVLDKISKQQNDFVLSFGTKVDADGAISLQGNTNHYFTIKNIDSDKKIVKLTSPLNTSETIELSYDDIKTLGISIDGGSIKESNLPNSVRSKDDDLFFGKKKKTNSAALILEEDIAKKDELKNLYLTKSKYSLEDMEDALACIDDILADKIRKTGDLYTADEILKIEELYNISSGLYDVNDIIKSRGSNVKLSASQMIDKEAKKTTLANELKNYVNDYTKFTSQDETGFAKSTENINMFISKFGDTVSEKTLYRGVLDESEISRLFSLIDYKQANPESIVLYNPGRLTSTTKTADMLSKTYGTKCQMVIEIPGERASDSCKMLDVNKIFNQFKLGENDFNFQEEVLFPSNVAYELKGFRIIDGIPTFIMNLYN